MACTIQRSFSQIPAGTVGTTAATAYRIPYRASAGGLLFINSLVTGTTITWHVCFDDGASTPVPLCDASGNALTTPVVTGKAYAIPDAAYGAVQVCAVINAGTCTAQAVVKA